MKCPECGGAPTDTVLLSDPPKYQCSQCDFVGTEVAWMTGLLRGDEGAEQAHAERLQAARGEVDEAAVLLSRKGFNSSTLGIFDRFISAKVTLALLERGS